MRQQPKSRYVVRLNRGVCRTWQLNRFQTSEQRTAKTHVFTTTHIQQRLHTAGGALGLAWVWSGCVFVSRSIRNANDVHLLETLLCHGFVYTAIC
jgi:hypothetical protein